MANVMITGGSRGIGAETVRRFAAAGHKVFYLTAKATTRAVAEETGAVAICADVADEQQVKEAFRRSGQVDILVCNAGISLWSPINLTSPEQWDRIFAVNVKGIYHCVNAALPGFLQKQAGAIVTVSSMWGQVGASCEAPYSATKGAVIALTKALAKELGPSGIRVNCVAPGVILTDMCANVAPDILEQLRLETPLEQNGRPEDVARAIEFLANAEFVTGQVLGVNGGYVM